jgi:hypothetical protein
MKVSERAAQIWSILALASKNRQVLTYDILSRLIGVPRPGLGYRVRVLLQPKISLWHKWKFLHSIGLLTERHLLKILKMLFRAGHNADIRFLLKKGSDPLLTHVKNIVEKS